VGIKVLRAGVLLCVLVLVKATMAQAPEDSELVIRSSVHEVLLDVIVRQKNLQLARKLTASDFTVIEDGQQQAIKTFRFVSGEDSNPAAEVTSSAKASPGVPAVSATRLEEPRFVSIVFDQLTPGTRKYAQDAAHAFLTHELRSSLYVSIFRMDYQTKIIQNFSNDRALLAEAVDRAVLSQSSDLAQNNSNVLNQTNYSISSNEAGLGIAPDTNLAQTPDLATAGADTTLSEGAAAQAKIVSDQRGESMYQGGMRAVTALSDLMKYEAALPGGKTVIYLSEGLNLPPDRRELLNQVIETAKKGQVTFYGIDVRGLGTANANALGNNLIKHATGNARHPELANQAMVANIDLNMDVLAAGTGGFSVFDSNEIGRAMLRVMEDVRTHYEISYTPMSENFDGHFRKIEVRVVDPKLTVQARDGYFSLPDLPGKSALPFETAGLRALDTKPAPTAFPFRVAALRFRPQEPGFQYEIASEVPTTNITPRMNADLHKARLHATFVALIKDSRGQVVDKVSHEIDENVPEDKLAQFLKGQMVFTTPVTLRPGRYTVESAVTDEQTKRVTAKRTALTVGRPGQFSVSDISLVRDLEPLKESRDSVNPLEFEGGRVTPDLAAAAHAAEATRLFFVVYPASDTKPSDSKPKVTVDFLQNGAKVATMQPYLSAPDSANSIPVIASAKLPVGDYEAQVTVEQNGLAARRLTAFSVVP
jgi:VWFA-related protein